MRNSSKKNFSPFHHKFISFVLIIVFIASLSFGGAPDKAQAFFPTPTEEMPGPLLGATTFIAGADAVTAANQTSLTAKEFVGDSLMWFVGKVILQKMTSSVVNWINNGFQGNPSFVSNPANFFANVGDVVASDFLFGNASSSLQFLCAPFGDKIRITLNNNRMKPFGDEVKCTLSSVIQNIDAFTSNFANGGWVAFDEMTQNDANNPYGSYLEVTNELWRRQNTVTDVEKDKLDWGKGFLSSLDQNGNVQTPGSVIENQLVTHLGTGVRTLEAADEINEILAALMQQLASKVLGSIAGGLRGLGNGSSIDDGGADLRSLQNIQMPPQGTYTPGTSGTYTKDPNTGEIIYTPGTPGSTFINNPTPVISNFIGSEGYTGGTGVYPPGTGGIGSSSGTITGGTLTGGTCTGTICTGGTYTAPSGATYTGGTYSGGTCSGTAGSVCTNGTYSGGTCTANCGSNPTGTGGTSGGGAIIGVGANYTCLIGKPCVFTGTGTLVGQDAATTPTNPSNLGGICLPYTQTVAVGEPATLIGNPTWVAYGITMSWFAFLGQPAELYYNNTFTTTFSAPGKYRVNVGTGNAVMSCEVVVQ